MLLSLVVASAAALSATRSRSTKTQVLAELLGRASADDAAAVVGLIVGRPRQGRVGIGWRRLAAAAGGTPGVGSALEVGGPLGPADTPGLARTSGAGGTPNPLTVADVDAALTAYQEADGPGSQATRAAVLAGLLRRANQAERDFLYASLTGQVRTGALDALVTDALALHLRRPVAEVRRAVMLSGNLGETVALGLRDPSALAEVGLTVGVPVLPMLASPAPSVAQALALAGRASVEVKLDGARIQVHRRGSEVRVYTRTLADVTGRVPEIVDIVRGFPGGDLILDGETLMLADDGTPRPFQETMSRFGAESAWGGALAPRFFDALHHDGRDLLDLPLAERLGVLADVVGAYRIDGRVTDDPVQAEEVLAQALAAGHEGVVVKSLTSPYAAGRRGKAWLKVKPVHTYDLVVLGAEWGSGRRRGWLSNLHLGARDPDGAFGDPGGFVMVGKTFKGLTDDLLRWQTETFPAYEIGRTAAAIRLRPEIVVEIAIDGVQRSSRYVGGLALRFARVKRYRPDKAAPEADTIDDLRRLLPVSPSRTGESPGA